MTPAQAFLANLQIATPCDAAWADMSGDDRRRLCAQCDKHVYNVAKLSSAEVLALFEAQGPLPCLRLWRRADGTVLTADCPVGLRKVGSRRTRFAAALVLALLASAPALLASAPALLSAQTPLGGAPAPMPHLMGKVACPAPQPKPRPTKGPKPRRAPKPAPQRPIMGLVAQPPSVTRDEVVAPLPKTGTPHR